MIALARLAGSVLIVAVLLRVVMIARVGMLGHGGVARMVVAWHRRGRVIALGT